MCVLRLMRTRVAVCVAGGWTGWAKLFEKCNIRHSMNIPSKVIEERVMATRKIEVANSK